MTAGRAADLAASIDALLPQTQCTKCGFDGCAPYAQAIAAGEAQINRCPPGGTAGIARLARLLGREPLPLDASRGIEGPRRVAWIDPQACIGCTKCIQTCPVDAIIGAQRRMHTVVARLCTGCDLCVAPCPVDCIEMHPLPATALHGGASPHWTDAEAAAARARHLARSVRLAGERDRRNQRLAERGLAEHGSDVRGLADLAVPARGLAEREFPGRGPAGRQPADHDTADHGAAEQARKTPGDDAARRKRAVIEAAMRRARERLAAVRDGGAPR